MKDDLRKSLVELGAIVAVVFWAAAGWVLGMVCGLAIFAGILPFSNPSQSVFHFILGAAAGVGSTVCATLMILEIRK